MMSEGCCTDCDGFGVDESSPETGGRCWSCYGTGHVHEGPCIDIADRVVQAYSAQSMNSSRSQQSRDRILGPSDLGGCRAKMAHTLSDAPRNERSTPPWAAFVGTWVGEGLERAYVDAHPGARRQVRIKVRLPSGRHTEGSCDVLDPDVGVLDFKGLAIDTPIPTPTGWAKMGELSIGDHVIDMDGAPTTVTAVSQRKMIGCYEVLLDRSSFSITCDEEHVWWVITRHGRLTEMRVTEMAGEKGLRIPVAQPVSLPRQDVPIDPWYLGYWLGNGSRGVNAVTTHGDDSQDVARRIRALGYETTVVHYGDRNAAKVGVSNGHPRDRAGRFAANGLSTSFATLGLRERKFVPQQYLRGSIKQRQEILAGLMDSDGTWNSTRSRAAFVSTDRALRDGVAELARSLGQKVSENEHDASGFGVTTRAYTCEWSPTFNPFSLRRKAAKVEFGKATDHASAYSVSAVRKVETVETVCIKVDSPTSSFLCGERMVPTHNSLDGLVIDPGNLPFKNLAQVMTYLLGAIQMGLLPEDAEWHLVYVDRSGSQPIPKVVSGHLDMAVIEEMEERISEAEHAALWGTEAPKDEPYNICESFCEFFQHCRGDWQPQGLIDHPDHIAAVERYRKGQALEKEGKALKKSAKNDLEGVEGSTGRAVVRWVEVGPSEYTTRRSGFRRLDIKEVK